MADSFAAVEVYGTDSGTIQTAVNDWITANTPTSIATVQLVRTGDNRMVANITYTA